MTGLHTLGAPAVARWSGDAGPGDGAGGEATEENGYLTVPWSYLARLDEVPCDVFLAGRRHPVLYATTGSDPASLRDRAAAGVRLLVRASDSQLLRRVLTVSLGRTLADESLSPALRSREAYQISASILTQTFRPRAAFDQDEANLVQETIDVLTQVLANEDETLWAMVASMQKSRGAHNHAINAAVYGLALAKACGIVDYEQLRDIGRGALLMDIGLTTIPGRILEKGEPLSLHEERALRRHPVTGFAIVVRALGDTPSYAHIIVEHHERPDGSGYPSGRKANQIALDSQIVGIADVFDDLTSDRPDRPPLSPFEACQQMRFGPAGPFNDELMKTFVRMLGGWSALRGPR